MVKKRRRHSAAYKFRIALEALEDSKTISQFSSEHEVHPNMTRSCKRHLRENGPRVSYHHGILSQTPDSLKPAEEHFVLCSEPAAFA